MRYTFSVKLNTIFNHIFKSSEPGMSFDFNYKNFSYSSHL